MIILHFGPGNLLAGFLIAVAIVVVAGFRPDVISQPVFPDSKLTHTEANPMHTARGTFEVKLTPRAPDEEGEEPSVGRMSIDKEFQGDLAAFSKGQMLAFRSEVQGSAGYVAMERVVGSLAGKRGSFVLQHSGTMVRGEPQQTVTVVPDSGTNDLVGLAGSMAINIIDGRHDYEFEYTLPETE